MADYGIRRDDDLRSILNGMYPLTGLGTYSTSFPPQTGAEQPSGPVPIPPPRPPMARPPYLPPPGAALAQAPGLQQLGGAPPAHGLQITGGGRVPGGWAAGLGLGRTF